MALRRFDDRRQSVSRYGEYRIIEPPTLLEYTWNHDWSDGDISPETVVRFELEEHGPVTTLRLTHSGFTSAEELMGHNAGWQSVLAWLSAYVVSNSG